jgi:cbb3-type cytochrome oxidase maturation protein
MSAIYIVLPLALLVALGAVVAFVRAVRAGQFDDLDTPSVRILHDDEHAPERDDGDGK